MTCRKDVPGSCSAYCRLKEKVEELWRRAANAIKTINNVQPDGENNLTIEAGDGIQIEDISNGIRITNTGALPPAVDDVVKTINYVTPDDEGDFILRGGTGIDIEEIDEGEGINGLEISCNVQAPEYTATAPIIITNNNISLSDFEPVTNTNWAEFAVGWPFVIQEDLILLIGDNPTQSTIYLPKGFKFQNEALCFTWNPSNWHRIISDYIWYRDIFKNGNNYQVSTYSGRKTTSITDNTSYYTIDLVKRTSPVINKSTTGYLNQYYSENTIQLALWVRK